jgi:DNA repair protein RecN (Recombination protein N)
VNAKLQLIYNLQKKHAASSVEELLEITTALREKVDMTENAEANLEKLQKEIQLKKEELSKIATEIHKKRASVIPLLQRMWKRSSGTWECQMPG